MDARSWQRLSAIFDEVADAPAPARAALLEQLCAGDAGLRAEIDALLAADGGAAQFERGLQAARGQAAAQWVAGDGAADEALGECIGPWRILHELGRGGMGIVLLAQRADGQFEQRAALKLIKRGMDSDAVQARFRRERQILAQLEHPNIARLLDGGLAADGRPYFAMEFVDGEPLLRHCARNNLKLEGRIELFLDICAAVQFAHSQLVVHRDIKPSNILVTASGEAKLLDFGIAKLLDDSSGGTTATIDALHRPLTPAYAAPEQLRGEPVTTATDIYALGGVLYELLTGRRPLAIGESASPEDAIRAQDISDPAPPSKVGGEALPIPARRLRGDLDTIALKALRREPGSRYATAAALAEDLQRYLSGQPIVARRDHTWYRVGKFVARHRFGVAAAAAGVLIIMIALGVALLQAREKTREVEVSREVTQFLVGLFGGADPTLSRGTALTAQDLLEQGTERLRSDVHMESSVRARLLHTVAATYVALGLYDRALPLASEALQLRRDNPVRNDADIAESLGQVGRIYRLDADYARAEPMLRDSLEMRRRVLPRDDPDLIESLDELGMLQHNRGEFRLAGDLLGEALTSAERHFGAGAIGTARYLDDFAANLDDLGKRAEGLAAYRRALEIREQRLGPDHPDVASTLLNLGVHLDDDGDYAGAVERLERAVAIRRKVFGPDHPLVGFAQLALAGVYDSLDRLDDCERVAESALAIFRRALPADHPKISEALNMLAIVHGWRRDFAGAVALGREVVERFTKTLGADHPDTLTAKSNLSYTLGRAGLLSEAEQLQRDVLARARADNGQGTLEIACENLAGTLELEGKSEEAVAVSRRAFELAQKHGGPISHNAALALRLLAVAEETNGDVQDAERDFRGALQMYGQLAPAQQVDTYRWQIPLADLLVGMHRCDAAVPLLDGASAGTKGDKNRDHWQPQVELLRGECQIAAGRAAEGATLQLAARNALRMLPGIEPDLYPTARRLFETDAGASAKTR